jgi:hypothetical protein
VSNEETRVENQQGHAPLAGVSERILSLKARIEKLEMKYADICEYAGEWSLAAEKCDKEILKLNDELASLYAR